MIALDTMLSSVNIADELTDEYLDTVGLAVVEGYTDDLASRADWQKRYENALKLAAQVMENKSFPWPGAANIKYPLLTTACVQFSARAYPALLPGTSVVQCRTVGKDVDGMKAARADRIGKHMSYQVLEEMEGWEEDMDRLLVMLPVTGTEFKKTYFDPGLGRNVSEHVLARDLVVNYWAKSLESATRKTHLIWLTPNEMEERMRRGTYRKLDLGQPQTMQDDLRKVSDQIQGRSPPANDADAPHLALECHCWWDLDGDGYKEPYIVTVHHDTHKVLRIVARFDSTGVEMNENGIVSIKPVEYFTKFSFIPALDGGFYDFGWGLLLGPINETVNTAINQLLDGGTLSNMQAGYISRGIKVRGGNHTFKPGEWKMVDSTGDDLRKGIVPLPVREPSATLFQLLGLMVESGEKLANVVDILLGENPGQNQPATTTMAVIEQGLKVFTAVYKRLYRALKKEYQKLYRLNRIYLPDEVYFRVIDVGQEELKTIRQGDYDGDETDVVPSADPNVVSEAQKLTRAEALVTSLMNGAPANPLEVWRRYYEAMGVTNIDALLPKQMPQPQPDPKILIDKAKVELDTQRVQLEDRHKQMEHQLRAAEAQVKGQVEAAKLELERARLAHEQQIAAGAQRLEEMRLQLEQAQIGFEQMRMELEREKLAAQQQTEREKLMVQRMTAREQLVAKRAGEREKLAVQRQTDTDKLKTQERLKDKDLIAGAISQDVGNEHEKKVKADDREHDKQTRAEDRDYEREMAELDRSLKDEEATEGEETKAKEDKLDAVTAQLTALIEQLSKPKMIVTDKSGKPIGIKPVDKL